MRRFWIAVFIVAASQAAGATVVPLHYWRFEDSPGFLEDSAGATTLGASGAVSQVTLTGTGPGAFFTGLAGGNDSAAETAPIGGSGVIYTASLPAPISGDFTVEVLAHFAFFTGGFGDCLVANSDTGTVAGISWTLQVRNDGYGGTQAQELILGVVSSGLTLEAIGSGIIMETGKDYYIATSLDLAGGEAVFYVQNLTDGDPLQVVTVAHSTPDLNPISALGIGNHPSNNLLQMNGLIDEVRITGAVLAQEDLYVNDIGPPVPEPATLTLVLLGAAFLGFRRRPRRS